MNDFEIVSKTPLYTNVAHLFSWSSSCFNVNITFHDDVRKTHRGARNHRGSGGNCPRIAGAINCPRALREKNFGGNICEMFTA